ncbi:MAG: hypothetical protein K2I96_04445 [Lachnospiraceae bacterium]|nr:hypothetical protein [Lachnospiraceae bacterium]
MKWKEENENCIIGKSGSYRCSDPKIFSKNRAGSPVFGRLGDRDKPLIW